MTTPPALPQLASGVYLTDSGLETDLIFNRGLDLPEFASFPLLAEASGRSTLGQYYADHWKSRLRGFRANASRKGHAELDATDTLDAGDPKELGDLFNSVREVAPSITILGGCCGTDVRHVEAIASATLS